MYYLTVKLIRYLTCSRICHVVCPCQDHACQARSCNVIRSPTRKPETRIKTAKTRQQQAPIRKYNVAFLKSETACQVLEARLDCTLDGLIDLDSACTVQTARPSLKDAVLEAANEYVGSVKRKHQDWFDGK